MDSRPLTLVLFALSLGPSHQIKPARYAKGAQVEPHHDPTVTKYHASGREKTLNPADMHPDDHAANAERHKDMTHRMRKHYSGEETMDEKDIRDHFNTHTMLGHGLAKHADGFFHPSLSGSGKEHRTHEIVHEGASDIVNGVWYLFSTYMLGTLPGVCFLSGISALLVFYRMRTCNAMCCGAINCFQDDGVFVRGAVKVVKKID